MALAINLEYDANALAAPQSFRDGVQAAANILDAAIYDPITVNIAVGYGEYNGTALPPNESLGGVDSTPVTYSMLRAALAADETSAEDATSVNSLPDTTSLNGQTNFYITSAQAKAFGMISATKPAIDGYVGFPSSFTGDTLIAAGLVEIAHAMGMLDDSFVQSLYHYTSPGNHVLTGGVPAAPSYFSIDGGNTNLADFNTSVDSTLFNGNLTPNDPFDFPDSGSTILTSVDLTMMDVLGFDVSPPITITPGPQNFTGGAYETIIGGIGPDVINALAGPESILGGSGATTVYGGLGDTITAGFGSTYIDGTAGNMAITVGSGGTDTIIGAISALAGVGVDTLTGGAAAVQIPGLGKGDVVNFAGQTGNATINATAGNVKVTLGGGPASVYGGVGDTINLGSVSQYVDGTAGGAKIAGGSGGTDIIIGSLAPDAGAGVDTLTGGAAAVQVQGLGKGDVVNFAGQTGNATINATGGNIAVTLGGGPATVYGGAGDTVNLGSVGQYADGTAGRQKISVGSGGTDIIIGSTAAAGAGADTLTSGLAAVQIQSLGKGDMVNFAAQTGNATINATAGNSAVNLGGGPATVYGGAGDTINLGSVSQYADGTAGNQKIAVGSGGTDIVVGSTVSGAGDTITGGAAALNYNSGVGNDSINLAGASGGATINGFGFDTGPVNDTVIAGNGGDSVWGGQGDRIGVGTGAHGTDLFTHASTIKGASIGFGTNDTVVAASYGSAAGAVTVNSALAGASSAHVSVMGFAETSGTPTDFIFYPNESSTTMASIVATSTQVTVGGAASTQFTLPDGTLMTLLGVPKVDFNTAFFKP